jgi:hypothetical protein
MEASNMPRAFQTPSPAEAYAAAQPYPLHVGGAIASEGVSPAVLDRLETIRELAHAAHRPMPTIEERQFANELRGDAQRLLDRLVAHPSTGGYGLHPESSRVLQQRQVLDAATVAARRVDDRYRRAVEMWTPRACTRRDCEIWINTRAGGTAVSDWTGPEPQLAKGDRDLMGAIVRLERRTRELRADLHRVRSSPFPLAHARERLSQIIYQTAQAPNVSALIEHEAGNIGWPMQTLTGAVINVAGRPVAFSETANVLSLMLWAMKEPLLARLDALLVEEADESASLSVEARQVQAAKIQDDLLAVERDLSWWTWKGIDSVMPVWFPADLNPAAILQAELVTVANGASPEITDPLIVGR